MIDMDRKLVLQHAPFSGVNPLILGSDICRLPPEIGMTIACVVLNENGIQFDSVGQSS